MVRDRPSRRAGGVPGGGGGRPDRGAAGTASEKEGQVGPEVGPSSAFYRCMPTGMHGPTCTLWANLTLFSRQLEEFGLGDGAGEPFATLQRVRRRH
jgi:hypothetical protein